MTQDIFPLRLSGLEHYLWTDDSAQYPMNIVFELDFEGVMDRDAFEYALKQAIQRHPILHANIQRTWYGIPYWVRSEQPLPMIDWQDDSIPVDPKQFGKIDLTQEAGLRLLVRTRENWTKLYIVIHHSCCDAQGAVEFLGDTMVFYSQQVDPDFSTTEFKPISWDSLKRRGDVKVDQSDLCSRLKLMWLCLKITVQVLWRRPSRLITTAPERSSESETSHHIDHELATMTSRVEKDVFPGIRKRARKTNVTLNDLFLKDLYVALRFWNREQVANSEKNWLTIALTQNLVHSLNCDGGACNHYSTAFISLRQQECDHSEEFLQKVRNRTAIFKKHNLSALFISWLTVMSRIPWLMECCMRLNRNRCYATAVFSYIANPSRLIETRFESRGDQPVIGNLRLMRVNAAPPVRSGTKFAVTAWHYEDQFRVGLKYDKLTVSREDAEQFLISYIDRLRLTAGITEPRQTILTDDAEEPMSAPQFDQAQT